MSIEPTIAEKLSGKEVTCNSLEVNYDSNTGIYKFSDGSLATIITKYEDCEPYQSVSLSTMSKRPVRYWKAL